MPARGALPPARKGGRHERPLVPSPAPRSSAAAPKQGAPFSPPRPPSLAATPGRCSSPLCRRPGRDGGAPAASLLRLRHQRSLSPLPARLPPGLALPPFCFGRTLLYPQASLVWRGSLPCQPQRGVERRPPSAPSAVQPRWDASVWASPEHIPFPYLFLAPRYLVL